MIYVCRFVLYWYRTFYFSSHRIIVFDFSFLTEKKCCVYTLYFKKMELKMQAAPNDNDCSPARLWHHVCEFFRCHIFWPKVSTPHLRSMFSECPPQQLWRGWWFYPDDCFFDPKKTELLWCNASHQQVVAKIKTRCVVVAPPPFPITVFDIFVVKLNTFTLI